MAKMAVSSVVLSRMDGITRLQAPPIEWPQSAMSVKPWSCSILMDRRPSIVIAVCSLPGKSNGLVAVSTLTHGSTTSRRPVVGATTFVPLAAIARSVLM